MLGFTRVWWGPLHSLLLTTTHGTYRFDLNNQQTALLLGMRHVIQLMAQCGHCCPSAGPKTQLSLLLPLRLLLLLLLLVGYVTAAAQSLNDGFEPRDLLVLGEKFRIVHVKHDCTAPGAAAAACAAGFEPDRAHAYK
jgi:hypothetical protein